ncbi:hypothetical protein NI382_03000 [Vibrio parahaemolyticus]|nr:hypothetical protein NI382_03000 [Vibrio parahaemolyticus]
MFCEELSKEVKATLLEIQYSLKLTAVTRKCSISMKEAEALLCNGLVVDFVVKDLGFELTHVNKDNISNPGLILEEVNEAINLADFPFNNEINGLDYIVTAIDFALGLSSYQHIISDAYQSQFPTEPLTILNGIELKTYWDDYSFEPIQK